MGKKCKQCDAECRDAQIRCIKCGYYFPEYISKQQGSGTPPPPKPPQPPIQPPPPIPPQPPIQPPPPIQPQPPIQPPPPIPPQPPRQLIPSTTPPKSIGWQEQIASQMKRGIPGMIVVLVAIAIALFLFNHHNRLQGTWKYQVGTWSYTMVFEKNSCQVLEGEDVDNYRYECDGNKIKMNYIDPEVDYEEGEDFYFFYRIKEKKLYLYDKERDFENDTSFRVLEKQ